MKQILKSALVAGPKIGLLALGLLASTSIVASAESSFAYAGGKKAYDQKIADAAANVAANKMGKIRGTITGFNEDAFISEEILKQWQNS